jgi:DAK2 domain fusion protein YloV
MLATMRAALAEAERLPPDERDLPSVAEALSRGALSGARGNSGVILSQIIRGMTHGADGRRRADGSHLARGLRRGSEVAYGAVLSPVEGTILTVIRDAAEAAEDAAGRRPHVEAVLTDVIAAAADSVQRTPQLLPILEDAGVVDSGGQGLFRLFEGMVNVDGARRRRAWDVSDLDVEGHVFQASTPTGALPMADATTAQPDAAGPRMRSRGAAEAGHGYETEFLVAAGGRPIDLDALRAAISALGDSVVVAGDASLVRVHVHGDRPDAAIAAGLAWGRLSDVSIRDLDDQVAHHAEDRPPPTARAALTPATPLPPAVAAAPAPATALVAVAAATGIAHVLESLGARVVRPGHGQRPSVGEIREAILASAATQVILLPNDGDALLAARHAAASTPQVEVAIVPTRNAAEGIAAAVAFDADASLEMALARMRSEATAVRSFTVIRAVRDATIDGVAIVKGQLVALDPGRHPLARGATLEDVVVDALRQMGDVELVTCYYGTRVDDAAAAALRERIDAQGWQLEVDLVPGGQRHDLLLVAVE